MLHQQHRCEHVARFQLHIACNAVLAAEDLDKSRTVKCMTYMQQPYLSQCQTVAKALVDKYPYLKNNEGDGDVSRIMY